jgi:hypothetical protein
VSPPRTRPHRRVAQPTAALFVRVPTEQAQRLDRAAFQLGLAKQEVVSGLLERYVDPDSPESLATLTGGAADSRRRRVTIEALEPDAMAVGHHSFRPREPEVLNLEEAGDLLHVEPGVLEVLAAQGELPARKLAGEWRFARAALLAWLAAGTGEADDTERVAPESPDHDR